MAVTNKQTQLYANLMHELKVRIDAINLALAGHTRLATPLVREFCWLQLRMLCELVALSCLVAHGDITFLQPHKLGKNTSAQEILDRLSRLREHFYPIACRQKKGPPDPSGVATFEMEAIDPSPLPKDKLLELYGRTHRHVHRGSVTSLLSRDVNVPWDTKVDAPEIVRWAQCINDLLSVHTIPISETLVIICVLRNADDKQRVQVATAEAGKPPHL
ncbi:MAG: hypothetical protein E5X34_29820 [Mesorhizobium sp.]|uniref:hypothetical protein n=1 Tax=Mesorhizobium sp. TaxID=1871066 RepID=UPI0011F92204|nr:hypothetical protein [Mesorhizobium sp.]TIR15294.1 MAG: hypothetical protein E5X34_29820 [Mesorhizobium sp.]